MDFVEQVKSAADIVEVIGEYVRLKKAGAGPRYTGLCPFHNEKTPSFSVHGGHQFYKCFGCGAGGDVFKFVMEIEGLGFFDALKTLAGRRGIEMPKRGGYSDGDSRRRAALLEMHAAAARLFEANLRGPDGAEARQYLERRGVGEEQWKEFGLGLTEPSGRQVARALEQRSFAPEFLEQSGLVRQRPEGGYYDYFRGRIVFPIHGESGELIGFAGRALRPGDEPKYLNSPETPLYSKKNVLYNLHRARTAIRKSGRSVLVEGYMDVIGVFAAGVREVVASCGTALSNAQVRALRRYSDRIAVNFDPDAAGANAAERSIETMLDENLRVRVVSLDGGLDPDEYVKQRGAEAYRARLDGAQGYFHWLADRARVKFDMLGVEGKLEAWKFLVPAIQRIPERLERLAIANDVAGYLGVSAAAVLEEFRKPGPRRGSPPAAPPGIAIPSAERLLLKSLLGSVEARREILPRLRELSVVSRFTMNGVFETIFQLAGSKEDFRFQDLESRLGEREKELLTLAAFADEEAEGESALEQARQCLRGLQLQEQEMKRSSLRNQIQAAERSGNLVEALRLAGELNQARKAERESGRP